VFLVDVLEAFKKRRRIATYGVFYNVQTKAAERGDQVCGVCGKPLTYVGTFGPEWLPVWELADYLTARRSRTATGAAA
jgi:hypothetical protein